jgi:hypothetical protein
MSTGPLPDGPEPSRRNHVARFLALSIAVGCASRSPPPSSQPERADLGDFEFIDHRGPTGRPVHVWYARPLVPGPEPRIVFILHGDSRTGRLARDIGAAYATGQRLVVVAPEFREEQYPGDTYDLGGMVDGGVLQPREAWALPLIEHLFDHLCERWSLSVRSYDILGHSAGGQFVQRLVLFVPEARFRRAVASGPGTVAIPDVRVSTPYGLGGVAMDAGDLQRSLTRDFVLIVGDRDIAEGPRPEAVLAQGKNRVSRAFRLFAAAHEAAAERGVPLAWRLRIVPGLDHSPLETLAIDFEEILK